MLGVLGPLPFCTQVGFKSWSKKEPQKKTPSGSSSWPPLGPLGGHLGAKVVQKGCQKETQTGVQNGAKSRPPGKAGKSEFDTVFTMF